MCAGESEKRIIDKRFEALCNTISESRGIRSCIRTLNTSSLEVGDIQTEVRIIVYFIYDERETSRQGWIYAKTCPVLRDH